MLRLIDCSTARSIWASWPIAPSGVCGNPVITNAGPLTPVPVGILISGALALVVSAGKAALSGTVSIGSAAISSRCAAPRATVERSVSPVATPVFALASSPMPVIAR